MKKEYAEEVAAKIIEQLEQGTAPWQKPWKPGELTLPYNAQTGKEYRGMNSMWLAMQGHSDPRWMTYNQAADAGAQVRKGSKGTKIMYWKFREERQAKDEQGRPIRDEEGKPKMVTVELERPRAFHAVVFNAEQIDGLPPLQPKQPGAEPERHARAEAVLLNSGAKIQHIEGDRAFYRPSTDSITLPERHQFHSADAYYATALHELGHWTGHSSRLDRDLTHPFGSEGYAKEELRAEIASLMLGERMGIGHDPGQHVAYVGSWIKALKEDPKEIFRAASDAEKITGFVMAFENELTQEQTQKREEVAAIQGDAIPLGWSESTAGGMATNPDPQTGGIVDVAANGEWFFVANAPDVNTQEGFGSRADAFNALSKAQAEQRNTPAPQVAEAIEYTPPPENAMPSRTYLAVPYAEKEQAKAAAQAAGFRLQWDKEAKSWFAPEGANLDGMEKWKPEASRVVQPNVIDSPEEQFSRALKEAGLVVDGLPIMDGKIHRVPVEGDKGGETSGAYAGHMEGRMPGGYIQNYKTGERVNWKAEGNIERASPEERAKLAAEAAQRQERRTAEAQAKYEATAKAATALWSESPAATAQNPYCISKGIDNPGAMGLRVVPDAVSPQAAALGIKIAKTAKEAKEMREADPNARVFKSGDLLVPGHDEKGKLWTLQSVNPYFKSFMKGGRKHGLFTVAGANPDGKSVAEVLANKDAPIVLAEGYATADTVAKLSGQPVIVAFDSGNLSTVAGTMRQQFPDRAMIIAADNDHRAPKELGPDGKPRANVGLEKAKETAEKYGAGVAAPQFKDGEKASDWNDLRGLKGDEEAGKLLAEQMAVAKRDAAIISERLTTLARTRDMEARNDPTTSADDAEVAAERGKAASMIVSAAEQNSQVRSASADAKVAGASKGTRPATTAKASIDRKTETLRDTAKRERQAVLSPAQATEKEAKEQAAKQPKPRRSRGMDAGL